MGTHEAKTEPATRWSSADDELDGARERLAKAMDRTGESRRSIATAGGFDRQAVGRFLSGERVPTTTVFIGIAKVLGVSLEWLLTGKGDETPAPADTLLDQRLPDFMAQVSQSGLGKWAVQEPKEAPTLREVAKALRVLRSEVDQDGARFYSRSDGVRVHEWGEFFRDLRQEASGPSSLDAAVARQKESPLARANPKKST